MKRTERARRLLNSARTHQQKHRFNRAKPFDGGRWLITKTALVYGTYNQIRTGKHIYAVPLDRLHEDDWVCHIYNKGGLMWSAFIPAYVAACRTQKQNPRSIAAYETTDFFYAVVKPEAERAFAAAGIQLT